MTEGNIAQKLIRFAIPLFLGNLFQQLYNSVDSAVVGKYIGTEALAAVSSSANLIHLVVSLFLGLAMGGSVIISQYYGARKQDRLHDALHTTIAFALLCGLAMSIFGLLFARSILAAMRTPDEVLELATLYFRIYFLGSIPMVLYNLGTGIVNAMGDSKRPLYFLIVASLVNILLDLLFVVQFSMGVSGVALATVLAQSLSAILVVRVLMRWDGGGRLILRDLRIHGSELTRIMRIGLPSGVQGAAIGFSNVLVQTNINTFGAAAIAGFGAYNKIDGFVLMPAFTLSMAMTTFTGQNIGAGLKERCKQGLRTGLLIGFVIIGVLSVLLVFITEPLLHIFTDDDAVIEYGLRCMHIFIIGYVILTANHCIAGSLRGVGLTKIPMLAFVICWCVIRIIWIITTQRLGYGFDMVIWGYPMSWTLSLLILVIYMKKSNWTEHLSTERGSI